MDGIGFQPVPANAGWGFVAMSAVRPALVVEPPPALDQRLRFGTAAEPLAVEQLVAQLAAETLLEAVLRRAARGDEGAGLLISTQN